MKFTTSTLKIVGSTVAVAAMIGFSNQWTSSTKQLDTDRGSRYLRSSDDCTPGGGPGGGCFPQDPSYPDPDPLPLDPDPTSSSTGTLSTTAASTGSAGGDSLQGSFAAATLEGASDDKLACIPGCTSPQSCQNGTCVSPASSFSANTASFFIANPVGVAVASSGTGDGPACDCGMFMLCDEDGECVSDVGNDPFSDNGFAVAATFGSTSGGTLAAGAGSSFGAAAAAAVVP